MQLERALRQALDAHEAEILALSQDLIRIPSENPPGRHYHECATRIRLELDRLGLGTQVVEAPGDAADWEDIPPAEDELIDARNSRAPHKV